MEVGPEELRSALLPLLVAGAALGAHHCCEQSKDAQRYFLRHNPPLYYMYKVCFTVLVAATLFNLHFFVRCLLMMCTRAATRAAARGG